jgi:hypothetical protein
MKKHTEQDIHDLCFQAFEELRKLEDMPTYEHNGRAISPIEKLNRLRAICRKVAAECDEIEQKIIEEDGG